MGRRGTGHASRAAFSDEALRALVVADAERGWRAFIEQHTATLLALIERAGLTDHDEAMEVYVLVCERLAENDCARLRRHDPARGPLAAWLARVLRNTMVDWVRSRAGRRRLFAAIEQLDRVHQRVFELYYWEDRTAAEIAEILRIETGRPVDLAGVLEALETIQSRLADRQRGELLSFVARTRRPASFDAPADQRPADPISPALDPESSVRVSQLEAASSAALAALPPEDAAILRLRFAQGLSYREIQRALHLDGPIDGRVRRALARLRELLAGQDAALASGASFLEGESR